MKLFYIILILHLIYKLIIKLYNKKESLFLSSPTGGGHGTRTEIAVAETFAKKGGKPLRPTSVPKICSQNVYSLSFPK